MKYIFLFILITANLSGQTKYQKINIQLNDFKCRFRDDLKDDSQRAFTLMSQVFSSQQFQDSIVKLNFKCNNSCDGTNCVSGISGSDILNTLFAKQHDLWSLKIKRSNGALGKTVPYSDSTIAYYENISGDMCNLPFDIALAVNLCHEYIHHLGYCHPRNPKDTEFRKPKNDNPCENENYDSVSYKEDIAYRIGWIAYDILLDWYSRGIIK